MLATRWGSDEVFTFYQANTSSAVLLSPVWTEDDDDGQTHKNLQLIKGKDLKLVGLVVE